MSQKKDELYKPPTVTVNVKSKVNNMKSQSLKKKFKLETI